MGHSFGKSVPLLENRPYSLLTPLLTNRISLSFTLPALVVDLAHRSLGWLVGRSRDRPDLANLLTTIPRCSDPESQGLD